MAVRRTSCKIMDICQWLSRDIDDHSGHYRFKPWVRPSHRVSYDFGLMSVSKVCLKGSRSLRQGYHDTSPSSELVVGEEESTTGHTQSHLYSAKLATRLQGSTCSRHIKIRDTGEPPFR